jgi:hypothetical protein
MSDTDAAKLRECIGNVAAKIRRFQDRGLGEQNTKASLVEPILEALGWDVRDPDEVTREFKPTSRDCPVDYALTVLRKPRLFVEAKGLGETLQDRKWIAQVLGYATVAGVEWWVLTDGDQYRLYNATAPLDAEEKLFCSVRLSTDEANEVARVLSLLTRRTRLQGEKAHFGVTLIELIQAKYLPTPLRLFRKYKGNVLEATLHSDGSVEFQAKRYPTCSTAAEIARGTVTGRRMNTNGWSFWQYRDGQGKALELIKACLRYLGAKGER